MNSINDQQESIFEPIQKEYERYEREMEPLKQQLQQTHQTKINDEQIKQLLSKFSEAYQKALTREQRKRLLHLLIHKITIGQDRKIESIQIKFNSDVLQELKLGAGDLSSDKSPAPFSFLIAI